MLYFDYTSSDYQTKFCKLDTHTLFEMWIKDLYARIPHIQHNADGETSIKPLIDNIMTNGGIINLLYFNYTSSDYQTIFVNLIHVHCLKCESRICMSDSLI